MGMIALGNFAGGMAKGIEQGQQLALRQAEDKRRQEEADLRLRREKQAEEDDLALRRAAAPVTMRQEGAGGLVKPEEMDNRDVGLAENTGANGGLQPASRVQVGGQMYPDAQQAQVALSQANSPQARTQRVSDELNRQGRPDKAMQYSEAAQQHADRAWNAKIRQAMMGGHEGIAAMATQAEGGAFKGKQVQAVPSQDGKSVSYSLVNPDGSVTPTGYTFSNDQNGVIRAGYMLSQVDAPTRYRNMVEDDKREHGYAAKERELNLRERLIDEVKIPQMESRSALNTALGGAAEARATAAEARAETVRLKADRGGDGADRETRLRWTQLHRESSRSLSEANKNLSKLTGSLLFMDAAKRNPEGPEAKQLEQAREDVRMYGEDRQLYGNLLGGKEAAEARAAQAGGSNGSRPAPTTAATKAPDISKVEGMPKGSRIGASTSKGWEVRDASGQLLGYVRN